MNKTVAGLFLAVIVAACGCSNHSEEQEQDHVFKGYEKALDKANQVQSQMDEAEEKRRKQIEEMTRQ